MNPALINSINKKLIFILATAPMISYFIVTNSSIKSGTYFFNALILFNLVLFIAGFLRHEKIIVVPFYLKLLLFFSVYTMFSDIVIAGKPFSLTYLFKHQLLFGFFAGVLIENTKFSAQFISVLTRILKIIFWLSIIAIIIQQFIDYNFLLNPNAQEDLETTDEMQRRLSSIYSYLGGSMFAGLSVLPILSTIIAEKEKKKETLSWLYIVCGAIFTLINKSRWMMINWVLCLMVTFDYRKITLSSILKFLLSTSLVCILLYQLLLYVKFDVDGFINERLLETNHGGLSEGAASSRLLAFEVFSELYPHNPVLGKGNLKFGEGATGDKELELLLKGRSSQIHVGYLSLLYWYGIAGAALFILFLVSMMKKLKRTATRHNYWGPYWGMMGFVLANVTLVFFHINVCGLLLCLVYNKYYEQQNTEQPPVS